MTIIDNEMMGGLPGKEETAEITLVERPVENPMGLTQTALEIYVDGQELPIGHGEGVEQDDQNGLVRITFVAPMSKVSVVQGTPIIMPEPDMDVEMFGAVE